MSFDLSRITFDPWKNFAGVVMEQGRVQLDSDWNEWLAELTRRIQAGTLDIFGHAAYPPTTPSAFLITATSGSPNTVSIGLGRMYVDGLLAENHGDPTKAVFDTALAELSGTPQPPDPAHPNPNPIDFTQQPWLPGAALPTGNGAYLFYLDVWTRAVDYLQDTKLVDVAVNVDTTGRLQTVWQVKYMANANGWTCATPDSEIPYPPASSGRLTSGVQPNQNGGPCCLTDGTGYTGQENQLYRVEIHHGGQGSDTPGANTATFKWSRDNGSVETSVTAINTVQNSVNATASQLSVTSLGRDQVLGFKAGDWVELLDDWSELWGNPGVLCQIDSVIVSPPAIVLTTTVDTTAAPPGPGVPANFPLNSQNQTDAKRHTRLRRWDQSGKIYDIKGNQWCDLATTGGAIPVPASDTTLVLENGVTVQFSLSASTGVFNVGDFWCFAARTADGTVDQLQAAPPIGIHHHYTKLSTVTFTSPNPSYPDCRTPWNPGGSDECGCCCTATVGDNVTSFGKYTSIQQAINSLPTSGPNIGGEVCILPGRYYEYISLDGLTDVVIHGCGAETRLASPTMSPGSESGQVEAAFTQAGPASGLTAIITVVGCTNVTLRDFAIEAADNEAGILLDGANYKGHKRVEKIAKGVEGSKEAGTYVSGYPTNVTITGLALTASTLPALISVNTYLLKCCNNRIAMKDVQSQWAAVYLGGTELHFEKNWIGLEDNPIASEWMPQTVVVTDLSANFSSANEPALPLANGGIQIAGGSTDVFVIDNEIEGGARNGITLGSFDLVGLQSFGDAVLTGLLPQMPDPASNSETLFLPSNMVSGNREFKIVAGDSVQNVLIRGNRIRSMGLCGIGPVGFFNLAQSVEIITIQNLTIAANTIQSTLLSTLQVIETADQIFGYGAICVPDVLNLAVRDNTITDFGVNPGDRVCGIYVLNGEQVEISRNQVQETRDWSQSSAQSSTATHAAQAGVMLALVTPPALNPSAGGASFQTASGLAASSSNAVYQPGLPALRIENNVVRVALGLAVGVAGYGPFSVLGNHFSTGGTVSQVSSAFLATGAQTNLASSQFYSNVLTVEIMNLGGAIETESQAATYTGMFNNGVVSGATLGNGSLSASSSGAVLFANNICQLEARLSGAQGISSVAIYSQDHVNFANNHCWVDGGQTALSDALIFAASVHVGGNRLQESVGSVYISGITFGIANITTHNIATYCLSILGAAAFTVKTPNVILDTQLCPDERKG